MSCPRVCCYWLCCEVSQAYSNMCFSSSDVSSWPTETSSIVAQGELSCLKDSAEQPVRTWADSYCSVSKLWIKTIKLKGGAWKARYSPVTGHDIINISRSDTVDETQGLDRLLREVVSQSSSSLALFFNYMKSNYARKELLIRLCWYNYTDNDDNPNAGRTNPTSATHSPFMNSSREIHYTNKSTSKTV